MFLKKRTKRKRKIDKSVKYTPIDESFETKIENWLETNFATKSKT